MNNVIETDNAPVAPIAPSGRLLTARDVALLGDLYRFGSLLRSQIQALHFAECGLRRCNRRLHALTALNLITGGPLPLGPLSGPTPGTVGGVGGSQWVYRLAPAAAPLIVRFFGGEITDVRRRLRRDSPTYLAHALEIAQVALTLRRFCGDTEATIAPFHLTRFLVEGEIVHAYEYRPKPETEPDHAGSARARKPSDTWQAEVFRPDAYACFTPVAKEEADSYAALHGFFEVDLGHTGSEEFAHKLRIHRNYQALGLFSRRYGGADAFLTLTLTTSERRVENLLRLAAQTKNERAGFTTLDAFAQSGPFGSIWHTPTCGDRCVPLPALIDTRLEPKGMIR